MMDLIRLRAGIALFLLLCSAGAFYSIWEIRDLANGLSRVDTYSEANALREARHFREDGLTLHYGLGTVYYPGMYPTEGFAKEIDVSRYGVSAEGVYTHYPPGPEYLLYAAEKLLGPEPVSRLRLLPIAIGWAAMLYLGLAIRRRFGSAVGWAVIGACVFAPTTTDGFIGLHYQGYAAALLMVEIGIAIGANARLAPFAILGFLQGWLSFDYVFLVAVTPLALEVVLPRIDPEYQPRWRLTLLRCMLAGGGFAAAHGLHFLQVCAYWGSLDAAWRNFLGAAAYRAGVTPGDGSVGYFGQALSNVKLYYYSLHPFTLTGSPDPDNVMDWAAFRFLGLSLGPWWLLITVWLMVWEKLSPGRDDIGSLRTNWHLVCLTGLVVTSLWFVVMVNHGMVHRHFLYRHLFLMFFVMILFTAATTRRLAIGANIPGRLFRRNQAVSLYGS
jgi:hypothetical protein